MPLAHYNHNNIPQSPAHKKNHFSSPPKKTLKTSRSPNKRECVLGVNKKQWERERERNMRHRQKSNKPQRRTTRMGWKKKKKKEKKAHKKKKSENKFLELTRFSFALDDFLLFLILFVLFFFLFSFFLFCFLLIFCLFSRLDFFIIHFHVS